MVNSLSFQVCTDDRLILRVVPLVDGVPLSARFVSDSNTYGLSGLVLGVRNCTQWPAFDDGGRLRLLSCECGAYDSRAVTQVVEDAGMVRWVDVFDVLTGDRAGEVVFEAEAYHAAGH